MKKKVKPNNLQTAAYLDIEAGDVRLSRADGEVGAS
jgi:hypothetical protein